MSFDHHTIHAQAQHLHTGTPPFGAPVLSTSVDQTSIALYHDTARDWLWCVTTTPNGGGGASAGSCQAATVIWMTVGAQSIAFGALFPDAVEVLITTAVSPPVSALIAKGYFLAVLPGNGAALANFRNRSGQVVLVQPIALEHQTVARRERWIVRLLHWGQRRGWLPVASGAVTDTIVQTSRHQ